MKMPSGAGEYGVMKEMKRSPAKEAPHAYAMRTQPSTASIGGKVVSKGSNVSGGNMNGGGKRR